MESENCLTQLRFVCFMYILDFRFSKAWSVVYKHSYFHYQFPPYASDPFHGLGELSEKWGRTGHSTDSNGPGTGAAFRGPLRPVPERPFFVPHLLSVWQEHMRSKPKKHFEV